MDVRNSVFDGVMSRVTLRVAVVAFRSVTAQPRVPFRLRPGWIIAIIGQTMPVLRAEPITGPQDWRNEIETDRL
jgi:hypothetical protein